MNEFLQFFCASLLSSGFTGCFIAYYFNRKLAQLNSELSLKAQKHQQNFGKIQTLVLDMLPRLYDLRYSAVSFGVIKTLEQTNMIAEQSVKINATRMEIFKDAHLFKALLPTKLNGMISSLLNNITRLDLAAGAFADAPKDAKVEEQFQAAIDMVVKDTLEIEIESKKVLGTE